MIFRKKDHPAVREGGVGRGRMKQTRQLYNLVNVIGNYRSWCGAVFVSQMVDTGNQIQEVTATWWSVIVLLTGEDGTNECGWIGRVP